MMPPIYAIDGMDLSIFLSKEAAESWVEPCDIDVGPILDSTGRALRCSLTRHGTKVVLHDDDSTPPQGEQLASYLRDYLHACGVSEAWLADADLPNLVAKSREFANGI